MLFYVLFFNYQMCKVLNAVAFYLAFVVCYQIKITVGNMPLFKVFHNAGCAAFIVVIWVILAVCTFACAVNGHINTPKIKILPFVGFCYVLAYYIAGMVEKCLLFRCK